jgi:hypothetical protein
MLRWILVVLSLAPGACSPAIDLPAPRDLKVRQLSFGSQAAVEVSWRLVLRVDRYLLHYDGDQPGAPYAGTGLSLVRWPLGCGDFDGGGPSTRSADLATPDTGADGGPTDGGSPAPDARWPGFASPSPFSIPADWCLDREESFTDAGQVPVETPGTLPTVRVTGLSAGQTYHFAVQVERRGAVGPLSEDASIDVLETGGGS